MAKIVIFTFVLLLLAVNVNAGCSKCKYWFINLCFGCYSYGKWYDYGNGSCNTCPRGKYFNSRKRCSYNYSPCSSTRALLDCEDNHRRYGTIYTYDGWHVAEDECMLQCTEAGQYYDRTAEECLECPEGTYQPFGENAYAHYADQTEVCLPCDCTEDEVCNRGTGECQSCNIAVPGNDEPEKVLLYNRKFDYFPESQQEANLDSQCEICDFRVDETDWISDTRESTCDDFNACSHTDFCQVVDGNPVCKGTEYTCLDDETDPHRDCQYCGGDLGCILKEGSECVIHEDKCGCSSNLGNVLPDAHFLPFSLTDSIHDQCQVCSSDHETCGNVVAPNSSNCDDDTLCTHTDVCMDGTCAGTPYTCPQPDICAVTHVDYPDGCNGDGTCTYTPLENNSKLCHTAENLCEVDVYCNGILNSCPTTERIGGTIVSGAVQVHRPLEDSLGTDAWLDSLVSFKISVTGFSVDCDILTYRVGIMKVGEFGDVIADGSYTCDADAAKMWTSSAEYPTSGLIQSEIPFDLSVLGDDNQQFIQEGAQYVAVAKISNAFGENDVQCSEIFQIDASGPSEGDSSVKDIVSSVDFVDFASAVDVDFIKESSTVYFAWEEISDNLSGWDGVVKYRYAIGFSKGSDSFKAFTEVGSDTLYGGAPGGTLTKNVKYYVTIEAYNKAGITHQYYSDGFKFDETPAKPMTNIDILSGVTMESNFHYDVSDITIMSDSATTNSVNHVYASVDAIGEHLHINDNCIEGGIDTTVEVTTVRSVVNGEVINVAAFDVDGDITFYLSDNSNCDATPLPLPAFTETIETLEELFVDSNGVFTLAVTREHSACTCGSVIVPVFYTSKNGLPWTEKFNMCPDMDEEYCEDRTLIGADYMKTLDRVWFAGRGDRQTFIVYWDSEGIPVQRIVYELFISYVAFGDLGGAGIKDDGKMFISWPNTVYNATVTTNSVLSDVSNPFDIKADDSSMYIYIAETLSTNTVKVTKRSVDDTYFNTPFYTESIASVNAGSIVTLKVVSQERMFILASGSTSCIVYPIIPKAVTGGFDETAFVGAVESTLSSMTFLMNNELRHNDERTRSHISLSYFRADEDLLLRWDPFDDLESGISHMEISIGTQGGKGSSVVDSGLMTKTNIGVISQYKLAGIPAGSLSSFSTYFIVLEVWNNAGLYTTVYSDALKYESSAPSAVTVTMLDKYIFKDYIELVHDDAEISSTTIDPNAMCFHWSSTDADSGIGLIEWGMATASAADLDMVDWQTIEVVNYSKTATSGHYCPNHLDLDLLQSFDFDVDYEIWVKVYNQVNDFTIGKSGSFQKLNNVPYDLNIIDINPADGASRVDIAYHNELFVEVDWSFEIGPSQIYTADCKYGIASYDDTDYSTLEMDSFISTLKVDAPSEFVNTGPFRVYISCCDRTEENSPATCRVARSNGVAIDTLVPVVDSVKLGVEGTDLAFMPSDSVSVYWSGSDTGGSNIDHYEVGVGECGTSTYTVSLKTNVGKDTSITLTDLVMTDGVDYCVTVFVYDRASNSASLESSPFGVDLSPPVINSIHDGTADYDVDALKFDESPAVTWTGVNDPGSGIESLEVCLGEVAGTCGVRTWRTIPYTLDGSYTYTDVTGLGGKFYISLRFTNGAGMETITSTDGFSVDPTNPLAGKVIHGLQSLEIKVTSSLNTLEARWEDFEDPESGVAGYWAQLGSDPLTGDIKSRQSVGMATYIVWDDLSLVNGEMYYVSVEAINNAGLSTTVYSGGVRIDTTPIEVVSIDVVDDTDAGFISSTSEVTMKWEFSDEDMADVTYEYAVGSNPNSATEVAWTKTTESEVTITGMTLSPGQIYYFTVIAKSPAQDESVKQSSSFQVDVGTPVAGRVWDSFRYSDAALSSEGSSMMGYWTGFVDKESMRMKYQIGISKVPNIDDVVEFADFDISTGLVSGTCDSQIPPKCSEDAVFRATITHAFDDDTYYFVVKAIDAAGNSVISSSNGIIIDTTPPIAPVEGIFDGPVPFEDISGQVLLDEINASWFVFTDSGSGIMYYRWAIGTFDDPESIMAFKNCGKSNVVSASGLTLEIGTTYFVTVEAVNRVKMVTTAKSSGVLIRTTTAALPNFTTSIEVMKWGVTASDITDRSTCSCPNDDMRFSLQHGECECDSPDSYFDINTKTCVACPDGQTRGTNPRAVCQRIGDNSIDNTADIIVPKYSKCSPPVARMLIDPDSGECICAPGSYENDDGECVYCDKGYFKPLIGNDKSACLPCSTDVDVLVLEIESENADDENEYAYTVGTTSGGEQWLQLDNTGKIGEIHYAFDLPFSHGTKYFAKVEGTNVDGVTISHAETDFAIDNTPPTPGVVYDGLEAFDIDYQKNTAALTAQWFDFDDAQSGIAKYTVMIGFTPFAADVAVIDVGTETTVTYATVDIPLTSNTKYYMSVTAENGVGLTTSVASNGVYIDTSGPIGTVSDGADPIHDAVYQMDTDTVAATWIFDDPESGIASYEWAVGTALNPIAFTAFMDVGLETRASISGLNLVEGTEFVITVIAYNSAGGLTRAQSDGCIVGTELPILDDFEFEVLGLKELPFEVSEVEGDIMYQSEVSLKAKWTLQNAVIPTKTQTFTLGKCPFGAHDVMEQVIEPKGDLEFAARQYIQLDSSYDDVDGVIFEHGSTYCAAVAAENIMGAINRIRTVESIKIDTTPPVVSGVEIVEGNVIGGETDGSACLNLTWELPSDPESPVLVQRTVFCRDTDCLSAVYGEPVNAALSGTGVCLSDLSANKKYRVGLAVPNAAHLLTIETVSFTVDFTKPNLEVFDIDYESGKDVTIVSDDGKLAVKWIVSDDESNINMVEYSVIEDDDTTFIDWIEVDATLPSNVYLSELSLVTGKRYHFSIRVTNSAGLIAIVNSNGVLFDDTPPTEGHLCIDREGWALPEELRPECTCICCDETMINTTVDDCEPLYLRNNLPLNLHWIGQQDLESGIEKFDVMLGTTTQSNHLHEWVSMTTDVSKPWYYDIPEELSGKATFIDDRSHVFTMRSTNFAGLFSFTSSQKVIMDVNPPECGSNEELRFLSAMFVEDDILEVEVEWDKCEDTESGIVGFMFGDSLDQSDLIKISNDPSHYRFTANVTTLEHGDFLEAEIAIFDNAGHFTSKLGKIAIDKTAPKILSVRDGIRPDSQFDRDLDCQSLSSIFGVNWDVPMDEESGITNIEAALGSCPGCNDILDFSSVTVGNGVRNHEFGLLSDKVSIGQLYYATIRVTNEFGISTVASSDGVRVICAEKDENCLRVYGAFACVAL